MTTLTHNATIDRLARILQAAMTVGSHMWENGEARPEHDGDDNRTFTELSHELLALFTLLNEREVQYLLVGGVALLRYVEGRNTDDIDLILSSADLDRMPEIDVQHRTRETARGRFRGIRVDLLLTTNRVFKLVLEHHATVHRFSEIGVPCATVEGLVILKLYSLPFVYAQGDLQRAALYENDLAMLCLNHRADVDALTELLAGDLNEGQMAVLRRIAREIQTRVERMRRTGRE